MIKNYYPCYVKIFYEQIRKKAKTPEEKYKKKNKHRQVIKGKYNE